MTRDEFLKLMCDALEIEDGRLTLDTAIKGIPEWDSIGWLSVMVAVDDRLGTSISPTSIREFITMRDIVDHLVRKGAPISI